MMAVLLIKSQGGTKHQVARVRESICVYVFVWSLSTSSYKTSSIQSWGLYPNELI
jgi:hypothetical protein